MEGRVKKLENRRWRRAWKCRRLEARGTEGVVRKKRRVKDLENGKEGRKNSRVGGWKEGKVKRLKGKMMKRLKVGRVNKLDCWKVKERRLEGRNKLVGK